MRIYGDPGGPEDSFERRRSRLRAALGADLRSADWQPIDCPPVLPNYQRFDDAISGRGVADPDFARGVASQHPLDRAGESALRSGVGLKV